MEVLARLTTRICKSAFSRPSEWLFYFRHWNRMPHLQQSSYLNWALSASNCCKSLTCHLLSCTQASLACCGESKSKREEPLQPSRPGQELLLLLWLHTISIIRSLSVDLGLFRPLSQLPRLLFFLFLFFVLCFVVSIVVRHLLIRGLFVKVYLRYLLGLS